MGDAPHIPVLIDAIIAAVVPVKGVWIDGTFGAGGYARALLDAGADKVIGIDRDPSAFDLARPWVGEYGDRLDLVETEFAKMDEVTEGADGVVLDLGVSSMQLDQPERGFSFMRDGPLDMRMGKDGPSAADLVNEASEQELADILYRYGEERASRRIARKIADKRSETPITTTLQLAAIIESCLPRARPGQSHPATRSFQALRIAVNEEYRQLTDGLLAAERVLRPGGILAVVSFHSVEDRIVKRFFQDRSGKAQTVNRYAPPMASPDIRFELLTRKPITADPQELAANPRARSATLRLGRRTDVPPGDLDVRSLGRPMLAGEAP